MNVWNLLSRLNKLLLPAIHKAPDLTRRLDQLEQNDQSPLKGDPLQR